MIRRRTSSPSSTRPLVAAFAAILALAAGCVSTTYEMGPSEGPGAQGPIIVRIGEKGDLRAFGRTYRTVDSLARDLIRHGAAARQSGGPDPVVLRRDDDATIDTARAVRKALVRAGVPAVTVQGPVTVTTEVRDIPFGLR